jgi:hypothetical protein
MSEVYKPTPIYVMVSLRANTNTMPPSASFNFMVSMTHRTMRSWKRRCRAIFRYIGTRPEEKESLDIKSLGSSFGYIPRNLSTDGPLIASYAISPFTQSVMS